MEPKSSINKILKLLFKHWILSGSVMAGVLILISLAISRKGNYLIIFCVSLAAAKIVNFLLSESKIGTQNVLLDLGFQPIDLDLIDWENLDYSNLIDTVFSANNEAVVKRIRDIYRRHADKNSEITSYIVSFTFSIGLKSSNISFQENFLRELRRKAAEDIAKVMGKTDDTDLKNEIQTALFIEVWFTEMPQAKCHWYSKPYIGGERIQATHGVKLTEKSRAAGVALVSQSYNWQYGTFDLVDSIERMSINKNIPIIVGPKSALYPTGVIDIYSKDVVGNFSITQFIDENKKLHLDISQYGTPHRLINQWVSDRGGVIVFKGHYRAGEFFPPPQVPTPKPPDPDPYSSPLKKNIPNIFQNTDTPVKSGGYKTVEILLRPLVEKNQAILRGTLAEEGNFEIEYKKSPNGLKKQYHIKKLNWMTQYFKKDQDKSDEYKNPANYKEFSFDTEGYAPIPFTEGFLMTGPDENNWLCLYLAAGSPATGGENRLTKSADAQMNNFLNAYANRSKITGLTSIDEATQGLVVKGNKGDSTVFLKLLNPDIANLYYTEEMIRLLIKKDALPSVIKVLRIDRYGKESKEGLLLFETPELQSLSDIVNLKNLDYPDKIEFCKKLALFCLQLIKNGIVCTDFTLKDTVIYTNDHDEYVFVCDYGSYIQCPHFQRGNIICKPEYEAPEDKYDDIELRPEPYQVFKLGLLFYQFVVDSSFETPDFDYFDAETYKESLNKTIVLLSAGKLKEKEDFSQLIAAMLVYQPSQRPTLENVIDRLKTL